MVRRSPLESREDPRVLDRAEKLVPAVLRYADVLVAALDAGE